MRIVERFLEVPCGSLSGSSSVRRERPGRSSTAFRCGGTHLLCHRFDGRRRTGGAVAGTGTVGGMDMSWWVAFAAVVLLALVVTLADGLGRGVRGPRRRTRPPGRRPAGRRPPGRPKARPAAGRGRPAEAVREPRPGEIWWAQVPYEDGPGSKDRPCLVLSVRGDTAVVAKITTKHHVERPGVIALPAGAVGDARERQSFLETDELRDVPVRGFRRKVGEADPELWSRVRRQG